MNYKKAVFKLVQSRKSERTFEDKQVDDKDLDELLNYISEVSGPFSGSVRVEMILDKKEIDINAEKLGTYGIIKGARYYLVCILEKDKDSLYQLGYILERVVLFLWNKGIGTCWMGGTFKRSKFAEKASLRENEYLPIVIPFGYPKEKRSITDKIVRLAASSAKRKPWSELFYDNSLDTALLPENAGDYKAAIEAVRLAPSASNKQPWRIIKKNDYFEFYLKVTQGYSDKLKFNIQEIDLGIAMAHFELVADENELKGTWDIVLRKDENTGLTHVATWRSS